ncbi:nuclear transport factor 2 family protein [Undibacterium sp. Rencai35W]|uniref:nuclear transport factor 2 family protein n=1 Tax=Undibacterium sp. Rencai35W TaxID=3413046 RepID=UPI003BF16573
MNLKERAIHFLTLAATGDVHQAYALYVSDQLIHHNPTFPAGAAALMDAMAQSLVSHPHKTFEVQRALQDGDLVAVHSKINMHDQHLGVAVVHLFRFADQRIVELWDIGQPVPETSPNVHGMF